ncbi:putative pentatricopeptide repeat-containing protein at1g77010 mitochondrial [Phtheirospermum japonicum]|uniref:Putative pentatricopeptide repeat-containing protein at1g77010 mitochondrial n=1 Tax=Phtheirospermum japonicum TaxID=374723 RepID=A0A830D5G5_9LAMI|nr:putative pentatricopeptide repeat-containing protein at1g77010 mitochondrial [Phtheirospermum japonicum]
MDHQDLHHYARLLNSFNTPNSTSQGKQLHLLFLKRGVLFSTLTIANRLLQMYARCGAIDDARNLFDEMPHRNCFTWNTLLEGYAKTGGRKNDMLNLFHSMPQKNEFSWNAILSGLARANELDFAQRLFNEMPKKDEIAWNTMIHGYARNKRSGLALASFKDFLKWETGQNCATVIGACSDLGFLDLGKQVHARVVIDDVAFDSVLGSSLVNMYGKCGDSDSAGRVLNGMDDLDDYSLSSLISGYANGGKMHEARKIFEIKYNPCVVVWNTMISGYVANGDAFEALIFFNQMHKKGVSGDFSTFSSILSACSKIGIFRNCVQLHAQAKKLGIVYDLVVASALIDAYAKCASYVDACNFFDELKIYDTVLLNSIIMIYCNCGRISEAKHVFDKLRSKSLISWNSMIVGLSQNGYPVNALELFRTMNDTNVVMDIFTLASAISACASISSFELGEQIFARAFAIGLDSDQIITTSLIDFYCKCGFIEIGRKLFNKTTKPDEVSFNSMLMGYATNGYGYESLVLFKEMLRDGVKPTEVTFTAILSACDHCGLVEEGKNWFYLMKKEYGVDPGIEHYSCMIDLLARAGRVEEAIGLIEEIRDCRRDASMWSAILRGCIVSGDKLLAKKVAEKIIELDPSNSGALVQLAGVLASSGDWNESALVRQFIRDMRIKKNPGRSWL